jgi:hypothetical protein
MGPPVLRAAADTFAGKKRRLVEQFLKKRFFSFIRFTLMVFGLVRGRASLPAWGLFFPGSFENFVELASIQPDPPAVGAVIDFNTLALRQYEGGFFAGGTFHGASLP